VLLLVGVPTRREPEAVGCSDARRAATRSQLDAAADRATIREHDERIDALLRNAVGTFRRSAMPCFSASLKSTIQRMPSSIAG
jgi:hypothetical protein